MKRNRNADLVREAAVLGVVDPKIVALFRKKRAAGVLSLDAWAAVSRSVDGVGMPGHDELVRLAAEAPPA